MKEEGFNLRKWISNSEKLMQWIDQEGLPIMEASTVSEEDKTYTQTQLRVNNSTISCERKILGLNWDIVKDILSGSPAKSGPLDFGTKNNFPSFFVSEKGLTHTYKKAIYYFPIPYFCFATGQN